MAADLAGLGTDAAPRSTVRGLSATAAIRHDRNDAPGAATDPARLASDAAAVFAAPTADLDALRGLTDADAGGGAAQSKLATDLPAVATAKATVRTGYTQPQPALAAKHPRVGSWRVRHTRGG